MHDASCYYTWKSSGPCASLDRQQRSFGRANVCAAVMVVVTGGGKWDAVTAVEDRVTKQARTQRTQRTHTHTHPRARTHAHSTGHRSRVVRSCRDGTSIHLHSKSRGTCGVLHAHTYVRTRGATTELSALAQLPRHHHHSTFFSPPPLPLVASHGQQAPPTFPWDAHAKRTVLSLFFWARGRGREKVGGVWGGGVGGTNL